MVIPKERIQQFQRWSVADFDTNSKKPIPRTAAPEKPAAAIPTPAVEPITEPTTSLPPPEELAQIYENARSEGYQAGLATGELAARESVAAELTNQASRIDALLESLTQALQGADQAVAEQLLDLSVDIAEQLIRGKLSLNRDFMLPLVREAINALPIHHAHIALRVHPDDYPLVKAGLGDSFFQAGNQLIDDPDISPGGCLLNAGASEIDASVETRWKRILEPLGATAHEWQNP